MRLSDQLDAEVSLVFPAAIDAVWAVVSALDRIGEWSPECRGIAWVPPAAAGAPGATFIGRNALGPIRWQTTCEIETWEPPARLSYLARHVTGAATWWLFELAPVEGGTRVTQRFETVGSPGWMMAAERLAGRPARLRAAMESTLREMRAAVSG